MAAWVHSLSVDVVIESSAQSAHSLSAEHADEFDQCFAGASRMTDYQVKPVGKRCAATGEALTPGSLCHSVLVHLDGELVRRDFSVAGWKGPPDDAVAVWKVRIPDDPNANRARLDPAALLGYFEQLSEEMDPRNDRLRYVAALLLLRRKKLRLEGTRAVADEEWLQVAGTSGEGLWEVRDLQLTDEEIATVREELNARLAVEYGEVSGLGDDNSLPGLALPSEDTPTGEAA